MIAPYVLAPVGGAFLALLILFEVLLGKRAIKLKGKLHQQVHRWTAYTILALAPVHGLYATQTFLGWPF